ncbi:MAG: hypothetical protein V4469_01000 [Patescibacteria group bacterium]
MTTIVNNPGNGDGGGMGAVVVLIVVIVLGALFFMYGFPRMRAQAPAAPQNNAGSLDVNVKLPSGGGDGTSGQATTK